jgi:hypothetical protein
MNRFGSSLVVVALGLGLLVGTSGCELQKCETDEGEEALCAKSLKRYVGSDVRPAALPYTSGMDLSVDGVYGDIHVVEGTSGEVSVVFEPFNYRAHDAEAQARDELENNLDLSVEDTGDAIVVTTGRHGATTGLGAEIFVHLPPEFDGALVLANESDGTINPGDIDAGFVGEAWAVDVSTNSLGDCNIDSEGSVVSTRAHCDGTIVALGISDDVDILSTGFKDDVSVVLRSVAGADAGGSITSSDGNIDVAFPSEADFTVQAQSSDDATVSASSFDLGCMADVAADSAKSYTCGAGGPNFVVTAGTDGGPSAVTLGYTP